MKTSTKFSLAAIAVVAAISIWLAMTPAGEMMEMRVKGWYAQAYPESSSVSACKAETLKTAYDPSSIEWANEADWLVKQTSTYTSGHTEWEVKMQVRGRNGFGALMLHSRTCKVMIGQIGALVLSMGSAE